jgi:hypothetical protein
VDSSSGGLGKSESSYGDLGDLKNSLVVGHSSNNHSYLVTMEGFNKIRCSLEKNMSAYVFFPNSFTNLEIETGGLLTLHDINLLNTVLEKDESVLLERNLKS